MTAADHARDKLEAAIWGVYNTGSVPPTVRVDAALRAAEKFADARAEEKIARMTPEQWHARLRLAEATAEADRKAS